MNNELPPTTSNGVWNAAMFNLLNLTDTAGLREVRRVVRYLFTTAYPDEQCDDENFRRDLSTAQFFIGELIDSVAELMEQSDPERTGNTIGVNGHRPKIEVKASAADVLGGVRAEPDV